VAGRGTMSRYSLYIMQQIIGPLLILTFSFTGVIWLTQSLRFIDLILNKGLSLGLFFYMTLLLLPSLLAIILPVALFVAVLYVYHQLISDREIIVLKAATLSHARLAGPALWTALIIMGLVYIINLVLMPVGFHEFKNIQSQVRNSFASLLLREGVFNTPINGLTIYVRERKSDGELRGILVHQENGQETPSTVMAESGLLLQTPDGLRLVMSNGNRQEVDVNDGELSLLYFEQYAFEFGEHSGQDFSRFREAKERLLPDLFWPGDVVEERHKREFMAEGHRRLLSPMITIALVFIALGALFSGDFDRRGSNWRLFYAVVLGLLLQAATLGAPGLMTRAPHLIPLVYLLTFGVLGCTGYIAAADPLRSVVISIRRGKSRNETEP
jgi:lipopolysaccharide export system permease protein